MLNTVTGEKAYLAEKTAELLQNKTWKNIKKYFKKSIYLFTDQSAVISHKNIGTTLETTIKEKIKNKK